jgi:hypothetical protein
MGREEEKEKDKRDSWERSNEWNEKNCNCERCLI